VLFAGCALQGPLQDAPRAPAQPDPAYPAPVDPGALALKLNTRIGHYLSVFGLLAGGLAIVLWMLYFQQMADLSGLSLSAPDSLRGVFIKLFCLLLVVVGVGAWWLVLTNESRAVAQEESERQTNLLLQEIEAHKQTDAELQRAKEAAESANLAKSRFVAGMSHECARPEQHPRLRTDPARRRHHPAGPQGSHRHHPPQWRTPVELIDGLLDIAKIEAGKMRLASDELALEAFLEQIVGMFAPRPSRRACTSASRNRAACRRSCTPTRSGCARS
jgi:signal transduction histidine kinase